MENLEYASAGRTNKQTNQANKQTWKHRHTQKHTGKEIELFLRNSNDVFYGQRILIGGLKFTECIWTGIFVEFQKA